MPQVHQLLASLGWGDAIGNEVLAIQRVLRDAGYASEIIVETADRRLEDLTVDYREMPDMLGADDLLIHHFSIGSRASRTGFALPSRMMLVYHNITPPEFFVGIHQQLVLQCYHGRRELTAYRQRCELAVGDSEFNRQELVQLGFPVTDVLAPVPGFTHLDVLPDARILDAFDDDWTNVLFVGRVVPSKRPDDLIRFVHAYRSHFNPRTRLLLAGSYGGFEGYLAQLHTLAATLGVQDVHIFGQVTNEALTALYDVADLFLCASEHEGFCVPLMEAFHKRVPVLAFAAAAVPATMDGGGVLYETKDPARVAAVMHSLLTDFAWQDRVLLAQDAALDRLQHRDFAGTLLGLVRRILDAPRPPMPAVTPDFWKQFAAANELEALRQYRPSAFRALPPPPAEGDAVQDFNLGS
jgi:glycosyltransferase involved in cell wall biosynthesis